MASAVAARAHRASTAARIEADLTALWQEVARDGPVSRAVMSNLVVFCRGRPGADSSRPPPELPIDEVASRHPARVIVLYRESDGRDGAPPAAHVTVVTYGPPDARYGVEQIVVHASCADDALPSIVRRLTLGGVPTTVWWTEDLTLERPAAPLVTMGRQLLYDSRRWRDVPAAVFQLAPLCTGSGADLADVNWRRLTLVRDALRHALASRASADRASVGAVRIEHGAGEAPLGWLLAGWLASIGATSETAISVREDSASGRVLTVTFDGTLTLTLRADRLEVGDALGPAPFVMTTPQESEPDAIAAELRSLTKDDALRQALGALAARFGPAR
jgi:glucose-6-phosphate dehydrogenase assembly protein OpcA